MKTEVLVENGGTVVIGGIYEQRDRTDITRVPFFGDLPYIGFLFKNNDHLDQQDRIAGVHHAAHRERAADRSLTTLRPGDRTAGPSRPFLFLTCVE